VRFVVVVGFVTLMVGTTPLLHEGLSATQRAADGIALLGNGGLARGGSTGGDSSEEGDKDGDSEPHGWV
jgi:hypothetical protein